MRANLFQIHILVNPKSPIRKLLLLHHLSIVPSPPQHHLSTIPNWNLAVSHSLTYHTLSLCHFSLKKKKPLETPIFFPQIETPLSLSCESCLLSKEVFSQVVIFSLTQFTLSLRCMCVLCLQFHYLASLVDE